MAKAKERSIIFTPAQVRAYLKGDIHQTRVVAKEQAPGQTRESVKGCLVDGKWKSPLGLPGEVVWVKESLARGDSFGGSGVYYAVDSVPVQDPYSPDKWRQAAWKWGHCRGLAAVRMPREYARIVLPIKSINCVERLQDICLQDIMAMGTRTILAQGAGVEYVEPSPFPVTMLSFALVWDLSHKAPGSTWKDNPWVWVYELPVAGHDPKEEV